MHFALQSRSITFCLSVLFFNRFKTKATVGLVMKVSSPIRNQEYQVRRIIMKQLVEKITNTLMSYADISADF